MSAHSAIFTGVRNLTAVALPQYSLLRFSGPDAQNFLHGQLTCDMLALQSGHSTYGGYCTPKGRLLATFLLWWAAETYTMMLPAVLAESIRKRLAMYVLRSKVTIADLTSDLACVGVFGTDAAQQITVMPEQLHGVLVRDGITVVHLPGRRFLKIVPREQADMIDGSETWTRLDIAAGIALITPATQEEFVPQMVNLDLVGALSYSKGCYPGQEIVARTHYLGKLKQRMYRARIAAPAVPGDKLYCAELGDQAGGMIVTAADTGDSQHDILAVLQTAHALSASWHLGSLQGPPLILASTPLQPA